MRITTTLAFLAVVAGSAAACSDSNPTGPDVARLDLGAAGNASGTGTDTAQVGGGQTNSSAPRLFQGTVHSIGAQPDTTKYEMVGGATVVLSAASGSAEVARAVSNADGTYTLGLVVPGSYRLSVTPPAGSPYKEVSWNISIATFAPATLDVGIWLARK
jgi:hypothetical protein